MGHSVSEELGRNSFKANLGKKPSDETRAKISRALSGDNNHSAKLTWGESKGDPQDKEGGGITQRSGLLKCLDVIAVNGV